MSTIDRNADHYLYRCRICGFVNVKRKPPFGLNRAATRHGTYGAAGTPASESWEEKILSSTNISFTAATATESAKINDSANQFADYRIYGGMTISVETASGTNDGDYTIADNGVSRGVLTLSTGDSLTTEDAATAGEVTINRRSYKPPTPDGCPFCGSLNS